MFSRDKSYSTKKNLNFFFLAWNTNKPNSFNIFSHTRINCFLFLCSKLWQIWAARDIYYSTDATVQSLGQLKGCLLRVSHTCSPYFSQDTGSSGDSTGERCISKLTHLMLLARFPSWGCGQKALLTCWLLAGTTLIALPLPPIFCPGALPHIIHYTGAASALQS